MGIIKKLMFWKHEDDFDFDKLADNEMQQSNLPQENDLGMEQDQFGHEKSMFPEEHNPLQQPTPQNYQQLKPSSPIPPLGSSSNSELELINSKLDTIKAMLASIEQRMAHLEKSSGTEQKQKLW